MRIDFVIGGTQKGGTSALNAFLRRHPEICMAHPRKETHFFDNDANFAGVPDYEQYHAHFQPLAQHRVIGEATPSYMYWEPAPRRVWSYHPAMKWVLLLRHPVERAYSGWNMQRKRGVERLSFREAVAQEAERCRVALPAQHRKFSYVDRSYYAGQVRRVFRIFGEEKCLVILNEDLSSDHAGTLRKVFRFLGVDEERIPPPAQTFQQSYEEEIEPSLRRELTGTFLYDIRELERMIHRDLSAWYM